MSELEITKHDKQLYATLGHTMELRNNMSLLSSPDIIATEKRTFSSMNYDDQQPRSSTSGGRNSGGVRHLLPSMKVSGRFDNATLELAYQRYSHRQRQKSLIVVNCVDIILKIATIILTIIFYETYASAADCIDTKDSNNRCHDQGYNETKGYQRSESSYPSTSVTWTSCLIAANVILCLLAFFWRGFANNYLHWAALATWMLMNLQGNLNCIMFPSRLLAATQKFARLPTQRVLVEKNGVAPRAFVVFIDR